MHTHTRAARSTTEATATDDPGLFVLAPARRRSPAQSGESSLVVVQYKSCACISPFYPGTAVGGAESLYQPPSLCASVLRAVAASPTRMQPLCCSIRCHPSCTWRASREARIPSLSTHAANLPSQRRARAGDWKGRAFLCSGRRVWPITRSEVRWLSILAPPSAEVIHSPAVNTKHRIQPKDRNWVPGLAAMRQTDRRGGLVAVSRALVQEGVVVEWER
jgi:hypothetical protein